MTPEQIPMCDICENELELDNTLDTSSSNAKYVKFMNESKPIIDLLKKADELVIPEYCVLIRSNPRLPALGAVAETQAQVVIPDEPQSASNNNQVVVEIQENTETKVSTNGNVD